jgi:hypothetical protein
MAALTKSASRFGSFELHHDARCTQTRFLLTKRELEIGGAVALSKAFLGHVYGSAGNRDKGREILHELEGRRLVVM